MSESFKCPACGGVNYIIVTIDGKDFVKCMACSKLFLVDHASKMRWLQRDDDVEERVVADWYKFDDYEFIAERYGLSVNDVKYIIAEHLA